MAICNFNLEFTFVLAGWEGTTHNVRVFQHALTKRELNFPKHLQGMHNYQSSYIYNGAYIATVPIIYIFSKNNCRQVLFSGFRISTT